MVQQLRLEATRAAKFWATLMDAGCEDGGHDDQCLLELHASMFDVRGKHSSTRTWCLDYLLSVGFQHERNRLKPKPNQTGRNVIVGF
jgi:hypothetical protein